MAQCAQVEVRVRLMSEDDVRRIALDALADARCGQAREDAIRERIAEIGPGEARLRLEAFCSSEGE
jgi:hypothetical protein